MLHHWAFITMPTYIARIDLNSEGYVAIAFGPIKLECNTCIYVPVLLAQRLLIATYPSEFNSVRTLHALRAYSTVGKQCVQKTTATNNSPHSYIKCLII